MKSARILYIYIRVIRPPNRPASAIRAGVAGQKEWLKKIKNKKSARCHGYLPGRKCPGGFFYFEAFFLYFRCTSGLVPSHGLLTRSASDPAPFPPPRHRYIQLSIVRTYTYTHVRTRFAAHNKNNFQRFNGRKLYNIKAFLSSSFFIFVRFFNVPETRLINRSAYCSSTIIRRTLFRVFLVVHSFPTGKATFTVAPFRWTRSTDRSPLFDSRHNSRRPNRPTELIMAKKC